MRHWRIEPMRSKPLITWIQLCIFTDLPQVSMSEAGYTASLRTRALTRLAGLPPGEAGESGIFLSCQPSTFWRY